MANTSGAFSFNLDLSELIEEAFERAGSEMRTGYDMRTARRSLNIMFADWANRGINMWTIEPGSITLVPGQNTYALPDDTIDLLEHLIRTNANNTANQADLTITRISVSTYATIPNKLTQARPIQVWIQRYNGQTSPVASTLTTTITSTSTSIVLSDVTGLPASGFVKIDNEIINYGYITQNTNAKSGTLYNCFRGQQNTTAVAHTGNTINTTAVTTGILQAAVSAQPGLALFGTTTVSGRPLGDINNTGTVTSADSLSYSKWASGVNYDTNEVAWIENTLNPYILANPVTYSAYLTAGTAVYWQQVPAITVWPTPDNAQDYTFVYWRLRRTQDAGGGVNIMDVPFRFIPCMAAGLSYYIAGKIPQGMERLGMLKAQYDEAWELAAYEDHEKAALRLVPRQTYIGR